jgi:hypothetical protein
MYMNCAYTYHVADSDSISLDSLDLEGLDNLIELDKTGNPVQNAVEPTAPEETKEEPLEKPANTQATKEE